MKDNMSKKNINKYYRIQINEPDIDFLFCLPDPKQAHGIDKIPKNSIIKITDFYVLFGEIWYQAEYNKKLFLITGAQFDDYLFFIHMRK